jgi:squalene synthase HpnC
MTSAATLASGKGHRDENFPVASRLISPRHRGPILAFYRFARAADDISDHPTAASAEKLAGLAAMADTLTGAHDDEPTALALRETLAVHGLEPRHALDLIAAFRQDVTKLRYADWDELMDYCRLSAMPVGRFVLDVHGETEAIWPMSDALCAALQVINHLQDCAKDYRALDRVYLPQDYLLMAGARLEDLSAPRASRELRAVISELARRTDRLLEEARGFSRAIVDRRLALEVAVIDRLARSLTARLLVRDPLSERVHHNPIEALALAGAASLRRMIWR